MLENTGTEDKLKLNRKYTNYTTQIKQTTQNTAKQNYHGSVALYHTRPGNDMGLFYNAPAQMELTTLQISPWLVTGVAM